MAKSENSKDKIEYVEYDEKLAIEIALKHEKLLKSIGNL